VHGVISSGRRKRAWRHLLEEEERVDFVSPWGVVRVADGVGSRLWGVGPPSLPGDVGSPASVRARTT
jgi:hypothetical protein